MDIMSGYNLPSKHDLTNKSMRMGRLGVERRTKEKETYQKSNASFISGGTADHFKKINGIDSGSESGSGGVLKVESFNDSSSNQDDCQIEDENN